MATYEPEPGYEGMRVATDAEPIGSAPVEERRRGDRTALYVTLASLGVSGFVVFRQLRTSLIALISMRIRLFLVGTWLLVFLNNPSNLGLFVAHPPLQAVAITCFGLGILQLQPTSQPKTKARGLARHQLVILGIGLPSIIVGTAVSYGNKVIQEASHFTTLHAAFGLLAIVWMIGQMLLGGLSVWFGGRAFGGGMKAKSVWKYHRASGYLLFPMFLIAAAIGGNYSTWAASVANVGVRVLLYAIAPIFALVGLWSRMRVSKMNFRQ